MTRSEYMREYRARNGDRMRAQERAAWQGKRDRVNAQRRAEYRPKPRPSVDERLWARVEIVDAPSHVNGIGPCWAITSRAKSGRYGLVQVDGQLVYAHRYVLTQALGRPLSDGMLACHRCDNKRCVRPLHLFEGSPAENMQDMVAKGRHARQQREVAP